MALLSFTAFATLAAPPIKDPSAPNIDRNGNAPPRFAVGSIRFFVAFFFVVFFFRFHAHADWSWLSSLPRRQLRRLSRSEPNLSQ